MGQKPITGSNPVISASFAEAGSQRTEVSDQKSEVGQAFNSYAAEL
jgi:hypothetical protein